MKIKYKSLVISLVLLVLLVICIHVFLIPSGDLENKHNETSYHGADNTMITADSPKKFEDYINNVSSMIANVKKVNENEDESYTKNRIDAAKPFELKPGVGCDPNSKSGVLLIHGLTDTPFLMKDIGTYLSSQPNCFLVRSILLPGHGTVPGDLLNIKYESWVNATAYGINSFDSTNIKNIYVVGFSTGGALALYSTITNDKTIKHDPVNGVNKINNYDSIKGLILLSPAIQVKKEIAAIFSNWHKIYSRAIPNGNWLDLSEDLDYAKYESFPKNAADQIHLLANNVYGYKNQLDKFKIPVFIAISNEDETVDSSKTIDYFKKIPGKLNKLIVYSKSDFKLSYDGVIIKNICHQNQNILDYSHTSIPVSINNQHYGKGGDYYSCSHYFKGHYDDDINKYKDCTNHSIESNNIKYGEISASNIKKNTLRRLSYNPNFVDLTKEIGDFIATTNH